MAEEMTPREKYARMTYWEVPLRFAVLADDPDQAADVLLARLEGLLQQNDSTDVDRGTLDPILGYLLAGPVGEVEDPDDYA